MASTAVASSSSPPYTGRWDYDVFVCFRGDDVRDNFMSHLEKHLSKMKIKTFVDTQLKVTQDIDKLLSILRGTAVSVVIFSKNFANSSWCLEEVATIAEITQKFGHKTLPVFFRVDWTTVAGDDDHSPAPNEENIRCILGNQNDISF
ncbi:unnamed protein product [Linum tenue]|uniref:TIR domain-containing protein n=2 Tax=Linum tenue TaxID=586396 RepID=A0AAV0MAN0_9ROSI|nr:unnamed protein product [Linum tenue]